MPTKWTTTRNKSVRDWTVQVKGCDEKNTLNVAWKMLNKEVLAFGIIKEDYPCLLYSQTQHVMRHAICHLKQREMYNDDALCLITRLVDATVSAINQQFTPTPKPGTTRLLADEFAGWQYNEEC